MNGRLNPRHTTHVEVLLNTLEAERHACGALAEALVDELRAALDGRAPESMNELLALAERGEMGELELQTLLEGLRVFVRSASREGGDAESPSREIRLQSREGERVDELWKREVADPEEST